MRLSYYHTFSFPGEGRGPVGKADVTTRDPNHDCPPTGPQPSLGKQCLSGGAKGFTLIEMMVALAVFSLAALALIRLEGATIRGASILDSTLTAQMVARNVAIEAMTDARAPIIGIAKGTEHNGGRTWNWTRETRPTGDSRIVRIDVEVMDAAGSRHGHLTVVRTGTVGGAAS